MKKTKNKNPRFSFSIILVVALIADLIFATASFSQSRIVRENSDITQSATVVPPQYQIVDITPGVSGVTAAQAFGISTAGVANGRVITSSGSMNFSWRNNTGGAVAHPNLSGRNFCVGNASIQTAPFAGISVGSCATTLFGTSRLPVIWRSGTPFQLQLPASETLGDANDVNSSEIAVGSVNSGSLQKAVYYSPSTTDYISQTTSNGSFFTTAYGINDSNRIVGIGIDPTNAARNVGMVFDIGSSTAFEVGALPNANGAINFAIGNGGHIVGASMQNQGSGLPFIWTQATGMVAIPLPTGTTQGSARAVNTAGWAVGTASSAFAIPFLYDGTATYRLQDLIPANSGWDLSTNTSSSAMGISDGNIIVGTGVFNGQTRAYAMVPMTATANFSLGGRVLTSGGNGISNATVTISGGNLPSPVTLTTGSFGYYNFTGLQSGQTYTVTVALKRGTLAQSSRTITLQNNVSDFDFTAEP